MYILKSKCVCLVTCTSNVEISHWFLQIKLKRRDYVHRTNQFFSKMRLHKICNFVKTNQAEIQVRITSGEVQETSCFIVSARIVILL